MRKRDQSGGCYGGCRLEKIKGWMSGNEAMIVVIGRRENVPEPKSAGLEIDGI